MELNDVLVYDMSGTYFVEYAMNERIQKLSEQAEKYADDNFRGEPTWSEAFESKFAELIVKECCQMMMDLEVKYPANLTVREIKKHFGVEDVDTQLRNRSTYFGNNP